MGGWDGMISCDLRYTRRKELASERACMIDDLIINHLHTHLRLFKSMAEIDETVVAYVYLVCRPTFIYLGLGQRIDSPKDQGKEAQVH